MSKFLDAFTETVYQMGPKWLANVRRALADQLRPLLQKDNRRSADDIARFWGEVYYTQLFPLRFSLDAAEPAKLIGAKNVIAEQLPKEVDLELKAEEPKRKDFLGEHELPPLLPANEEGETSELLADRLLTQAALANLLLRQQAADPELLHEVRLACLIYPFLEQLTAELQDKPRVVEIAEFFNDCTKDIPPLPLNENVMTAIRDLNLFADSDFAVGLGLVAIQRVKRYVFETSGLNEIRGASTLLDNLTATAKVLLEETYGPEVVLRAVGSTLIFLAPTLEEAQRQVEEIRGASYRATGTAFTAVAHDKVRVNELLNEYPGVTARIFGKLAEDRAGAELPLYETLPFETRCRLCRTRPAEGWDHLPGEQTPSPLCRVCKTKREVGVKERPKKSQVMIEAWLHLNNPAVLGVSGNTANDYVAPSLGQTDSPEPGFIPAGVRRPLLATIYGDGNNFGAVGQNIKSIAQARQWNQRVEKTTRAAAAIALARATQETARSRRWQAGAGSTRGQAAQAGSSTSALPFRYLPFQVLALGGDDLSLFAWGPVGIRFCHHFLQMTDLEFRPAPGSKLVKQPIAFSLGALFTDHKAAVRRTVFVAEEELLKWAKQAFRDSELAYGNVAPLLADTQEQVPDDLEQYRLKMYRREGALNLYLTLRPFSAGELNWLLQKAQSLGEASGPFRRLVSVFARSSPLQAMLHYIYQLGRINHTGEHWLTKLEDKAEPRPDSLANLTFPASVQTALRYHKPSEATSYSRQPFGLKSRKREEVPIWFTPLWDLLELIKILE